MTATICPRCGGPDLHRESGLSLTRALARHGVTHVPAAHGRRRLIDADDVDLGEMTATEGWCLVHMLDEEAGAESVDEVAP